MKFNFLNGQDGEQSSKRLFTFILIVLFVTVIISNLYWGFNLDATLKEYLFYAIMFTFLGVTLEGWKSVFSKNNGNEQPK
jgi:hypothetical protein